MLRPIDTDRGWLLLEELTLCTGRQGEGRYTERYMYNQLQQLRLTLLSRGPPTRPCLYISEREVRFLL